MEGKGVLEHSKYKGRDRLDAKGVARRKAVARSVAAGTRASEKKRVASARKAGLLPYRARRKAE